MEYTKVIDYWFGRLNNNYDFPKEKAQIWFNGGEKIDQEIAAKFSSLLESNLESWLESNQGWLAAIVVLDQFPRNIYRGTPKAFAYDEKSLELCLSGIKQEKHKGLFSIEKQFALMPLQHSEELSIQEISVKHYNQLAEEAPAELQEHFANVKKYAYKHYEIIKKFDRFPHRNQILGRSSTSEEIEFLKTPGSSF